MNTPIHYQRVSPRRPCAICDKTSWCLYDPAAGIALCTRIESSEPDARFHGYLHRVQPTPEEAIPSAEIAHHPHDPLSDDEVIARDRLYKFIAAHHFCQLTEADRENLYARGLDDEAITRHGYFAYPDRSRCRQVMRDLEAFARSNDLTIALWRLPGIEARDRKGGGFYNVLVWAHRRGYGALAIPVRDTQGRVIAISLRHRDDEREANEPRYTWLSSRYARSGAPVHIAQPHTVTNTQRLIITEGALKANIAADRLGCRVIAVPGIHIWRGVLPSLRALEAAGVTPQPIRIALAYDQEPTNAEVAEEQHKLHRHLTEADYTVSLLTWKPSEGKGIDDALHNGADITESAYAQSGQREASSETSSTDESKGKRAPSIADRLVALAHDAALFHDAEQKTWATVPAGTHQETWPLHSKSFKRWLARRLYDQEGKTSSAQAMQDALTVLDGRAAFDGPMLPVYVRLAEHNGEVYLDLGDEGWRVVRIDAGGWSVVSGNALPVKFRRPKGMLPLPMPEQGGTLDALRAFVNVADESDDDWRLLIAWLLSTMRASGPFPILALNGEMGSAKTTLARVLRALVDPNAAPVRAEPKELRDLAIAANNSWAIVLDNLSNIPVWLSDGLCRLSTGGGSAYRTLYENDEETIFDAQRPIILTGIEEVATRGDLVDRAILLTLPTIPDKKRRPESAFWRAFEQERPAILGALLDAVVGALASLPETRLETLPRMADFALWVTAAEKALEWKAGTFLAAYNANRTGANTIALECSPVAERLITFMENRNNWDGTPTQLHDTLKPDVDETKGEPPPSRWPKTPRALSGALTRLAPNLRRIGIAVTHYRELDGKRTRKISLTKEAVADNNEEYKGDFASSSSCASEEPVKSENKGIQRMRSSDAKSASDAKRTQLSFLTTPDVEPVWTQLDAADAESRQYSLAGWHCPIPEHANVPLTWQGEGRPPHCSDPYCDLEAVLMPSYAG